MSHILPKAHSPFEWDEYFFPCIFEATTKPHQVGSEPLGVCRHFGLLCVEEYRSDLEPNPGPRHTPLRLIVWKRPTRNDRPAGWYTTPFARRDLNIGFHILGSAYYKRWSRTAQYYRRRWHRDLAGKKYIIESVSFDEFARAFAQSTVAREIPTLELNKLRERISRSPDQVHMLGVRRLADGSIVAGHAWFESPSVLAGHYSCGFYLPEVAKENLMYALMDAWFEHSQKHGLQVLHLGTFQPPDGTWKRGWSISYFKGQFVTDYILYQRPIWKIA